MMGFGAASRMVMKGPGPAVRLSGGGVAAGAERTGGMARVLVAGGLLAFVRRAWVCTTT